jgi:hypothetical protein
LLFGISVGTRFDISHLLFVDNTLVSMGLTQIIYAICGACFYVLKLSRT